MTAILRVAARAKPRQARGMGRSSGPALDAAMKKAGQARPSRGGMRCLVPAHRRPGRGHGSRLAPDSRRKAELETVLGEVQALLGKVR